MINMKDKKLKITIFKMNLHKMKKMRKFKIK